jgi:hypothetical protein
LRPPHFSSGSALPREPRPTSEESCGERQFAATQISAAHSRVELEKAIAAFATGKWELA